MPLSSLRPRTANEQLSPQEEHEIPSPYRARSSTIPGLTPRKSLQSLMGSMRRRNNLRFVVTSYAVPESLTVVAARHLGFREIFLSKAYTPSMKPRRVTILVKLPLHMTPSGTIEHPARTL